MTLETSAVGIDEVHRADWAARRRVDDEWSTTPLGATMFRFTIRDVLWLTVVVALAVGWGKESRRRVVAAELAEANARETESFRVLTKFLTDKIKAHNPIRQLEI
jgi:hypothetical protein